MRGADPSLVIYDEVHDEFAESSLKMAQAAHSRQQEDERRALREEYAKLREELNNRLAAGKSYRPDPMWKKPADKVDHLISESRVREELGKSRGFRDLKPLMSYLNDATDVLVDKAQRFDAMEMDLEDEKDMSNRYRARLKEVREQLSQSDLQVRRVRGYLDELTDLAATFGSEASQDLATIVKGLAKALGEA